MASRCLVLAEPLHHGGTAVEVRPALEVGDGDEEFRTDRREQISQVELFDSNLDIDIEIVPKADRDVVLVGVVQEVIDPSLSLGFDVGVVESLNADGLARIILGADVERQIAGLAAVGDQLLTGAEVTLA